MPSNQKTNTSVSLPISLYWEIKEQFRRFDQEKVRRRTRIRLSMNMLYVYAMQYGLSALKKATLQEVIDGKPLA